MKKLDWYAIKTFLGPFFFIFSVLFFIFLMFGAWKELDKIAGKGLDWFTIAKLLFLLGINVVQLVLPLTILLGSIMTFGGFGERYELAAMKSTGISLTRIMRPLFLLTTLLAIGLFFFADRVMPYSQEQAKTMIYNLIRTQPTLSFKEGVFIEDIPKMTLNVSKISGENNEFLEDVFIQQNANFTSSMQTIRAKSGLLQQDSAKKHYLKMELYNGYLLEEVRNNAAKWRQQPQRKVLFDTLVQYQDISDFVESKDDTLGKLYTFLTTAQLKQRTDSLETIYDDYYQQIVKRNKANILYNLSTTDSIARNPKKINQLKSKQLPWVFDSISKRKQSTIIQNAVSRLANHKQQYTIQKTDVDNRTKFIAKHKLHYQRSFSYAFMCIVFFLIGAPLGAIVKKGGIGMPVVISIIVFVLFFIINFAGESSTKTGVLNGHFSAWLANIVFLPIGIFLVYQANSDSDFLTASTYTEKITKFFQSIIKKNTYLQGAVTFLETLFPSDESDQTTEHERYQ